MAPPFAPRRPLGRTVLVATRRGIGDLTDRSFTAPISNTQMADIRRRAGHPKQRPLLVEPAPGRVDSTTGALPAMPKSRKSISRTRPPADTFSHDGLRALLAAVQSGDLSLDAALDRLKHFPLEETEIATLDHHRALRKGFCEVIYCAGKTPAQVADIAQRLAARSPRLLGTRASAEQYAAAHDAIPHLQYDPLARILWLDNHPSKKADGVAVVCAGTSDLPVAEEAALTLQVMGHNPLRIRDVGVAGLHRLVKHLPALQKARVVIAVAGMEGALPSVIAGLLAAPVIAVPTSVGYGASFGGIAALLAMLNSCASGITVVNIDNGFGAAYAAAMINQQCLGNAGVSPAQRAEHK